MKLGSCWIHLCVCASCDLPLLKWGYWEDINDEKYNVSTVLSVTEWVEYHLKEMYRYENMLLSVIFIGVIQNVISSPTPSFYTPYYKAFEYLPTYTVPKVATFYNNPPLLPPPDKFPALNILAEVPSSISTSFTVVPMVVVAKENMNLVSGGEIMTISKEKPEMTLKVKENNLLQATPAVRIALDQPILVYSIRSQILFPSSVEIVHQGYKLPIRIGTVIAPVEYNNYIATNGPLSLTEVYAVPAGPVRVDYVNNDRGVIINQENDAVIIEDNSGLYLPPKNISILVFPTKEDEPLLVPDEEDDELVNRNPPIVLAPGGISASLQPTILEGPFSNSKESPILTQLREEALKRY